MHVRVCTRERERERERKGEGEGERVIVFERVLKVLLSFNCFLIWFLGLKHYQFALLC